MIIMRILVFFLILGGLGFGIYRFVKREWLDNAKKSHGEEYLSELSDRKCPYCGELINYDRVICPHCYQNLKDNCPICGEIIDAKDPSCPHCGSPLNHPES